MPTPLQGVRLLMPVSSEHLGHTWLRTPLRFLLAKPNPLVDGHAWRFRGVITVNRPWTLQGHKAGLASLPGLIVWEAREALDTATNSGFRPQTELPPPKGPPADLAEKTGKS